MGCTHAQWAVQAVLACFQTSQWEATAENVLMYTIERLGSPEAQDSCIIAACDAFIEYRPCLDRSETFDMTRRSPRCNTRPICSVRSSQQHLQHKKYCPIHQHRLAGQPFHSPIMIIPITASQTLNGLFDHVLIT